MRDKHTLYGCLKANNSSTIEIRKELELEGHVSKNYMTERARKR